MNSFKDFNIQAKPKGFVGDSIKVSMIFNLQITVFDYEITPSTVKEGTLCLKMQIEKEGVKRVIFTGSNNLMEQIKQVPKDKFPFTTKIVAGEGDRRYEFS